MDRSQLALVRNIEPSRSVVPWLEKLNDHLAILQSYFDSFVTRNYSPVTLATTQRFVTGWFEGVAVRDSSHPAHERQLLIWEAMAAPVGRERIVAFAKGLILTGLKPRTVQSYMGELRRLFDYVLEFPYIPGTQQSIVAKYGSITQPVSPYDYPVHVVDTEEEGFVLTGDRLLQFYNFIRLDYISKLQKRGPAQRDYTMVVLAGESGLRANELTQLDAFGRHKDLFYDQNRIQTRAGKATKGSGPRVRKTIFTPFAQATLKIYEAQVRPFFPSAKSNPALFLSEQGTRLTYRAMWRNLHVIVEAGQKAGLDLPPKMSWHSLRKSFATNFMERYPDKTWILMDMLGHINPSTLHRYVKHSRAYYDEAIDRVVLELGSAISE